MTELLRKLRNSPLASRAAPFLIFAALTSCQGLFGEASKYWIYFGKSVLGIFLLWAVWPSVKELRWTVSLEAILVGVGIIVIWVGIDRFYPKLVNLGKPWNPNIEFGQGSGLAWFFIVSRILGSTLIVPPLEEIFYRSFVYRYVVSQNFLEVPLRTVHPVSLIVTSTVFGLSHREWLAGILCGLSYQWLVIRKGHLGDAVTAHAISNLLLGGWVVYRGAWQFW
jgi:CAAX prenyl protease-like protein